MGQGTKISWAHDTLNSWIGCTKYAAECANCYAAGEDHRRYSRTLGGATAANPISHWGKGAPRYRTKPGTALAPLQWNKRPFVCSECGLDSGYLESVCICRACGGSVERRRVFAGSLMDWADEEVPDSWRDEMFDIADQCRDLIFMFLTKRGENAQRYIWDRYGFDGPPEHFWGGQSWMQDRPLDVAYLLATPWRVRFLSVEPMIGPFDPPGELEGLDWVIFGGESGPNARPCDVEWIRDGIQWCWRREVAPFVKQLGSNAYVSGPWIGFAADLIGGTCANGYRLVLEDRKGGDPAEWSGDLRVQEVPR